jgi:hypothetical protein
MVSGGHFILKCRSCGSVIQRCRCCGPHDVRYGLCQDCQGNVAPAGGAMAAPTPSEPPFIVETVWAGAVKA